ncbi:MAG: hypothetical protein JXA37_05935, partial [Chloroflexia bacterium]|nr:hypothetical protein [Chloroflexia bacterium]
GGTADQSEAVEQVASARLIVGPWIAAVAGGAGGAVSAEFARALVESAADKLLAPLEVEGWDWAGLEAWKPEAVAGEVGQIARSIRQRITGRRAVSMRRLSTLEWIAVIAGIVALLVFLAFPLLFFLNEIAWAG